MSQYEVLIPLVGYVSVIVEAENEKEAKQAAFEESDFILDLQPKEGSTVSLVEFDLVDKVVQGNVCYAPLFYCEVNEI